MPLSIQCIRERANLNKDRGSITGIHVSRLSRKKREMSVRAVESALLIWSGSPIAHVCLSADGSCIRCRTGHPFAAWAAESRRRRLSLCSLPVPKQSEESLGSCLRRPAGDVRDLAVCASMILMFFLIGKVFQAAVGLSFPSGTKSVFRLSTASIWATIFLATASVARLVFPRCRSRSYSRASSAL